MPSAVPSTQAVRKWMPPNTRAFLISSKAAEKLVNLRVTPGMAFEPTLRDVSSPNVCDRICVAAALTQECAEGYSGKAGVVISGVHAPSGMVLSLPSVSPSWIAVIGRHEL